MNLFIDCEWNDGELLSMALCAEGGDDFYEVIEWDGMEINAWVKANVIPVLNKDPVSLPVFRHKLAAFLRQYESCNIIADWPEDIAHFCKTLICGPGLRINTPPLSMEIVRADAPSALPHNALEDARAIREYFAYSPCHEHIG